MYGIESSGAMRERCCTALMILQCTRDGRPTRLENALIVSARRALKRSHTSILHTKRALSSLAESLILCMLFNARAERHTAE